MMLKYLITGATGGFGGHILDYFIKNVPLNEFAVSSSQVGKRPYFEGRGVQFRHLDYEDSSTLEVGLRDVQNLLFVSTNTNVIHIDRIHRHHQNVVLAAAKANVRHVCGAYIQPSQYVTNFAHHRCGTHLCLSVDLGMTQRSRSNSSI